MRIRMNVLFLIEKNMFSRDTEQEQQARMLKLRLDVQVNCLWPYQPEQARLTSRHLVSWIP